jgi:hypothetical protein
VRRVGFEHDVTSRQQSLPHRFAHLDRGDELVDVGEAFGLGILRPDTFGTSKVRYPRGGRHTRPRENYDVGGRLDDPTRIVD